MNKKHKHVWIDYFTKAVGYWEKRDCPGDGIYFDGKAEMCDDGLCGKIRFICEDPRYRIVEVYDKI